ncbi:MAG: sel1 repeat family protein [Alphaproteobacteria bacterium]|nr:sel1 repeat family protein [Alphaproteobacteria bacterium]
MVKNSKTTSNGSKKPTKAKTSKAKASTAKKKESASSATRSSQSPQPPSSTLKQATQKLRQGSNKYIKIGGATIQLDMFSEMLAVIRDKNKRPPKIVSLMILSAIILAVIVPLYLNKNNEEDYQAIYQEFYNGDKGNADIGKTIQSLDRLFDSKHGGSANLLGKIYFQGKLLEKDEQKAMEYYQVAAIKGYAEAQYQLAMQYYQGDIYEQDYEKAVALLLPASRQGHMHAQRRLGYMYQHGLGTQTDKISAYGWLAISGKLYNSAQIGLESLKKELSADEIAKGEETAKEYMARYYNPEAAIKFRDEWFH